MQSSRDEQLRPAFARMLSQVQSVLHMQAAMKRKECVSAKRVVDAALTTLAAAAQKRARRQLDAGKERAPDALERACRFTDALKLDVYQNYLWYVPRVVNVVTLAEAVPLPGSETSLPLDLRRIACRCKNAYFAPRRFAAVQLAYSGPRSRVLVFHTGRMVGTGCSGMMSARVALLRAQRQLHEDAGVYVTIRNFKVINQVGASALDATLQCEAFAQAHSSTAHYDARSFVGLAWRPVDESICCEIYSTGRANLPGSTSNNALLASWARMIPELLRFSSASRICELLPEEIRNVHRPSLQEREQEEERVSTCTAGLWDGWGDSLEPAADAEDDPFAFESGLAEALGGTDGADAADAAAAAAAAAFGSVGRGLR